jgi:hypothetical protein
MGWACVGLWLATMLLAWSLCRIASVEPPKKED